MGDTKLFEVPDTGSRILPVLPDDGAQSASDPVIDGPESGGHLGVPEIPPPASGEDIQPSDDLLDAQPATSPGEFTHPLFEPLDRFGVNTNLRVIPSAGETETQKRPPPGMADDALFRVDFQPKTSFNEPRHRLHHSLGGFLRTNVDHEIIRPADKTQPAFVQLFVKLVQYNIGQKRRKRPALRGALQ